MEKTAQREQVERAMTRIIEEKQSTIHSSKSEGEVSYFDALNDVYVSLMERIESGKMGEMDTDHLRYYILASAKHYLTMPKRVESLDELQERHTAQMESTGGYNDDTESIIASAMVHYDDDTGAESKQVDVIKLIAKATKGNGKSLLSKQELKVLCLYYLSGKSLNWIAAKLDVSAVWAIHQRLKAKIASLPLADLYRRNVGVRIGDSSSQSAHYWPICDVSETLLTPIAMLRKARASENKGETEKAERAIASYRDESKGIAVKHKTMIQTADKNTVKGTPWRVKPLAMRTPARCYNEDMQSHYARVAPLEMIPTLSRSSSWVEGHTTWENDPDVLSEYERHVYGSGDSAAEDRAVRRASAQAVNHWIGNREYKCPLLENLK